MISLTGSLIILVISILTLFYTDSKYFSYNYVNYYWMKYIGNSFYVGIDSVGRILTLLTAVSMPLILISSFKHHFSKPSVFYGLMMLAQCGIMGVFCSLDALLFYFFWELALIPAYFLCSIWGGQRRIQVTFKFFVYTFIGSLLMLAGILYVYQHSPGRLFEDGTYVPHSFSFKSFYATSLSASEQGWLFWLFFAAFAVKMPIVPFHTWQPDTYDQAPGSVTMLLSGLMVKMGLLGVIRWLIPMFPLALPSVSNMVIVMSVAGIIYASFLALVQDNLKKLVAYSSIAHMGLMCAALFSHTELAVQGAVVQMFTHGVNIIGLWFVVDLLEKKTGFRQISQLGGMASKAPALTVFAVIMALANIALPLTNAFAGEMMMFGGLFQYSKWLTAVAGLSVILAALYTLNMLRNVFFGNVNASLSDATDISWREKFTLSVIVLIIFISGIYPQLLISLSGDAVEVILGMKS